MKKAAPERLLKLLGSFRHFHAGGSGVDQKKLNWFEIVRDPGTSRVW